MSKFVYNKIPFGHEEYFEHNGLKEGIYKKYHSNGLLYLECNYINGLREGVFKRYHDNGQLYIECNYINGLREGIFKTYNFNGQIIEECMYVNGKKMKQKLHKIFI